MNTKTRLLFRADGNSQIGLGHVVRCLALTELLQSEFDLAFAIRNPSPELAAQIKNTCPTLISLPETDYLEEAEKLAKNFTGQEIIVLDGYHFSTEYQQILKQKGNILICFDDLHDRTFLTDVIINIAGGIKPDHYQMAPYSRLFSGPAFALLRKPFLEAQKTVSKNNPKPERLLICFGGADPENFTLEYVKKLHALKPTLNLEIVLGSAYRHRNELQELTSQNPKIKVHRNLTAEAMAELMKDCGIAITSASSVAYEYCAVNGMLFIEKTASNQHDLYEYLLSEELALPVSEIENFVRSGNLEDKANKLIRKQRQILMAKQKKT